ncbi:MAG: cell division protein FtsL [Halieaceae bacterium]|nr:cell division protein FtsL [Halieaceae bacterium]
MSLRLWRVILLALAVMLSGFAVISVTQQTRNVTTQLQVAESRQWFLRDESSRLLLELSTYTRMDRVDQIGADMGMVAASPTQIRVVPNE